MGCISKKTKQPDKIVKQQNPTQPTQLIIPQDKNVKNRQSHQQNIDNKTNQFPTNNNLIANNQNKQNGSFSKNQKDEKVIRNNVKVENVDPKDIGVSLIYNPPSLQNNKVKIESDVIDLSDQIFGNLKQEQLINNLYKYRQQELNKIPIVMVSLV